MDAAQIISEAAKKARLANRTLVAASNDLRSAALYKISGELTAQTERILAANAEDMKRADESGMAQSMKDRLLLTSKRIEGMADGMRQVAD